MPFLHFSIIMVLSPARRMQDFVQKILCPFVWNYYGEFSAFILELCIFIFFIYGLHVLMLVDGWGLWRVFAWVAGLGVLHWVLDADAYESDPELKQIRNERGYDYEVCPPLHVWTFYVCDLDSLEV